MSDTASAWGTSLQTCGCAKCGIAYLAPSDQLTATCPTCFVAKLTPQPTRLPAEAPELLVPFKLNEAQIETLLTKWIEGVWLKPAELNAAQLRARLHQIYLPMFLVDGQLNGAWQAQMGYDYQVISSCDNFVSGKWQSQQVTETRVRWEDRLGTVERGYENIATPALDEHDQIMRALGDYQINTAQPYTANAVTNQFVRVPTLTPQTAWGFAQSGFHALAANECATAAGAQHHEKFSFTGDYQNLNWTQLLLPLYTTAYTDDEGKVHRVFIHGQSGRIHGKLRASTKMGWLWSGITAGIAFSCFIVTLLSGLIGLAVPPLLLLTIVLAIFMFVLIIAACVPILWAWRYNSEVRTQK